MANNFRITGDYYVSKEGSDANSGLTPDLPKLTVQAALNLATTGTKTIVIGTGVYNENISYGNNTAVLNIIGDGKVVLMGDTFLFLPSVGITLNIINIEFRYSSYIALGNSSGTTVCNITSCILNSNLIGFTGAGTTTLNFNKCIFINIVVGAYATGVSSILVPSITSDKCIFINSSIVQYFSVPLATIIINSYFDSTSVIFVKSTITAANFNFNNIQGKIVMNTGTYSGIALSYADHRTQYPTFNVNSMSVAPLFNNVQNLDFTLQSTSPHTRAASDFQSNIGGTEYAKHYEATSTEFTSGATITDLTLQGDGYVITSPATEGRIITAPLAVQSYPATKPLTGIIWNGSLEFNKSITGGLAGNQQVPAYDTYTSGAGATPDRLKIKMRYSTQSASPTAGQWDNGGYWAVDTYQLVEVNVKPKVDSNGIGNGSYTYIEFVGLGDLVPTWIQLDIKLRNDYNI